MHKRVNNKTRTTLFDTASTMAASSITTFLDGIEPGGGWGVTFGPAFTTVGLHNIDSFVYRGALRIRKCHFLKGKVQFTSMSPPF